MTTEQGNKLIAEFMGFKFHPEERDTGIEYVTDTWSTKNQVYSKLFTSSETPDIFWDLKFHDSWEWLMPVVEKIEDIKDSDGFYLFNVVIQGEFCHITQGEEEEFIIHSPIIPGEKLKVVWKAIVEFIKWYKFQ